MLIGVHPDRSGKESYSEKWTEFLRERGVSVRTLDLLAPDALRQVRECDGVMCRILHNPHQKQSLQRLLFFIEQQMGIPVFPDTRTAWHYDEKALQYYLLDLLEAPVPDTWLFWRKEQALAWANNAPYPLVLKLSAGASAENVIKVQNEGQARAWIHRAFNRGIFPSRVQARSGIKAFLRRVVSLPARLPDACRYAWNGDFPQLPDRWWKPEYGYIYFQEFLPDNAFDTRVTIMGDRAFGYRRMNRPNDFRASGSGRNVVDPGVVDKECIRIAFDVSKRGGFQAMSYDFLYKRGRPVINEISYTTVEKYVYDSPGHWDSDLNWHEGHMWPEEAQVEDFLERVRRVRSEHGLADQSLDARTASATL